MAGETYGAKCHRCTHLLGPTHQVDPVEFFQPEEWRLACAACSFCQGRVLSSLLSDLGYDFISKEVRDAVRDHANGRPNVLVDKVNARFKVTDS